jgi:hypothetical protein
MLNKTLLLGITGFLDFVRRSVFQRTQRFGNWICPQVRGGDTCSMGCVRKRLAFSNKPTEYVSPTPTPEDGKKPIFQNVVFFGILDDGQSPKTQ